MKVLEKSAIILLFLAAAFASAWILNDFSFTGNFASASEESRNFYSHTKAICNGENFCEDFLINCAGDRVLEIKSTGYAVQFPDDWKDLRDEEAKGRLC